MNSFNERLEAFSSSVGMEEETSRLKELLTDMTLVNENSGSLLELIRKTPIRELSEVVDHAIKAKYIIPSGVSIRLFDGEYTVVVLKNGFLSGICEYTDGPVHERYGVPEYGYTLVPYALAKAYRRLFLERNGFKGGIMNLENNMFLRGIGPENVGVFIGDAAAVELKDHRNHGSFVVGVSGALMTPEFVEFLTGGNVKEYTSELFAGLGDVALAEVVAQRLGFPNLEVYSIPRDVSQLALWH